MHKHWQPSSGPNAQFNPATSSIGSQNCNCPIGRDHYTSGKAAPNK